MVAAFLEAEFSSSRFSTVRDLLRIFPIPEEIVTAPNLEREDANHLRKLMLFVTRGYPIRNLFAGFPRDCVWSWCHVDADELLDLQYVNVPSWGQEISGGTRRPDTGAAFMEQHPDEEISAVCSAITRRFENGETLSPVIVVGEPGDDRLVVLEGNARLTAMVMASDVARPTDVRVLMGVSPGMSSWAFW